MDGPLSPASQGKGFQATVNRFFVEFEFMICFPAASFMSFVPKIVRTCVNLQMPFAIYFTSLKNKLYAREEKCGKDWHAYHSIYIRTVSSQCLLTTLLYQLKLVYWPFVRATCTVPTRRAGMRALFCNICLCFGQSGSWGLL